MALRPFFTSADSLGRTLLVTVNKVLYRLNSTYCNTSIPSYLFHNYVNSFAVRDLFNYKLQICYLFIYEYKVSDQEKKVNMNFSKRFLLQLSCPDKVLGGTYRLTRRCKQTLTHEKHKESCH